jgi:hypothetical protein
MMAATNVIESLSASSRRQTAESFSRVQDRHAKRVLTVHDAQRVAP